MAEEGKQKKRKQFGVIIFSVGIVCIVGLGLGLVFGAIPPDAAGQALVYLLVLGGGVLILYGLLLLISGSRQKQFETIFEEVVPSKEAAITEKIESIPEVKEVIPEVKEVIPEVKEVIPEVKEVIPEVKEVIPEVKPLLVEKIQNYIEKKQSLKKFKKSLKTLEGNINNLRNIEISSTVIHALENERAEVIQQIKITTQEVKEDLLSVSEIINEIVKGDPVFGDKLKEFLGDDWAKIEEIWAEYNAELLSAGEFIEKCYEIMGVFFLHYFLN